MRVNVVLNLRRASQAQLVISAAHYTTLMTGNPLFAAADSVALVTATAAATTAMSNAIKAGRSDVRTDTIKSARAVLESKLIALAAKVADVANNASLPDEQRVGVVHSAGMKVKEKSTPPPRTFKAKRGEAEGSVLLIAPRKAQAHEWQYTADVVNFTGRIAVPATAAGRTTITSLQRFTEYAFYHKPVLRRTITEWEGPVILLVL
jgi:hypothetical protein